MITKEWKDFILSMLGTIGNVRDRFDLQREGRLVNRELLEKFGDKFEVMEITDLGNITVWTTSKVWCIRQEAGLEKLIYLPRNPRSSGM